MAVGLQCALAHGQRESEIRIGQFQNETDFLIDDSKEKDK